MLSALCQFRYHLLCQRIRSHAVPIDENPLQIIFFRGDRIEDALITHIRGAVEAEYLVDIKFMRMQLKCGLPAIKTSRLEIEIFGIPLLSEGFNGLQEGVVLFHHYSLKIYNINTTGLDQFNARQRIIGFEVEP